MFDPFNTDGQTDGQSNLQRSLRSKKNQKKTSNHSGLFVPDGLTVCHKLFQSTTSVSLPPSPLPLLMLLLAMRIPDEPASDRWPGLRSPLGISWEAATIISYFADDRPDRSLAGPREPLCIYLSSAFFFSEMNVQILCELG